MVRFAFLAAGLGYGLVSGAFATVNILRDLAGPGTVGINGDSQYFFIITGINYIVSALLCDRQSKHSFTSAAGHNAQSQTMCEKLAEEYELTP